MSSEATNGNLKAIVTQATSYSDTLLLNFTRTDVFVFQNINTIGSSVTVSLSGMVPFRYYTFMYWGEEYGFTWFFDNRADEWVAIE
ncbi:MAG: hypothetical protein HRU10_09295 [Opitutales bacterium]|nr:hypothetical protein [Opitutales bacterium]